MAADVEQVHEEVVGERLGLPGLRASSPAADQLVFGDAVLGEKALRVVVLDRVR
jgi:hypothetical protein